MEEWETVIKGYRDEDDPKVFLKVLLNAEAVLAEELTPFEIEWILSTLLQEPVHLIEVVMKKRTDRNWDNCIRDALKLLAYIVTKHDDTEKYYEQIVQICELHYEPLQRQQALLCLAKVVHRSSVGACNFTRYVSLLEESTTCKAALAGLVGTICEHHPNIVEDEITTIWRVFLNLLDSNKYTVTVTKAVLEGISGLFRHFGTQLPTMELNIFYDDLVNYLEMTRCEEVCLKFLQNYSHLFRERISSDKRLCTLLWRCDGVSARPAILSVYGAVWATVADANSIREILYDEIVPRTKSSRFYTRFTALRVLTAAHRAMGRGDVSKHVDLQVLQCDMRNGNVNYETCEAVSWCVQSDVPFSDSLLQTAILYYDSFPANKRTEVIVHSLLRAEPEMRATVTNFLIAESICPATKEQCVRIWRDIFDTKGNTDDVVLDKSRYVVTDVFAYVARAVETFLELDDEPIPDAIPALLSLLLLVFRLNSASDLPCSSLARALCRLARAHSVAVPAAILCCLYSDKKYTDMTIDRCSEEDMRLQFALAVLEMPDEVTCPPDNILMALETIFSMNDMESSVLSKAVRKLGKLLEQNGDFDKSRAKAIIKKVIKLSQRINKRSKDDRILYWDIITYLGEYRRQYEYCEETNDSDNILIYNLKNTLILDLPHNDGSLQINLQGVLHSAIKHEDPTALNTLLTIICANSTRKHPTVQTALVRVLVSLSHCGTDVAALHTAASLCDGACANELMRYVVREKSLRARKVLLGAAEVLLQLGDEGILENIVEYVVLNRDDQLNQCNIDITEFLLKQLQENNSLCEKYLPGVMAKILRSDIQEARVVKMCADIFMDKIGLYATKTVKNVIEDVFRTINSYTDCNTTKVNLAVELVKSIWEIKDDIGIKYAMDEVLDYFFEIVGNRHVNLRIVAAVTRIFSLDNERVEKAFMKSDFIKDILSGRYYASKTDQLKFFHIEVQLELYNQFPGILRKIDNGRSLNGQIVELTPREVIKLNRKLSIYLSTLNSTDLEAIVSAWITKQPISQITAQIERYIFESVDEEIVQAAKIMLNACRDVNDGSVLMKLGDGVKRWAEWIARLHETGYVETNSKYKMAFFMDLVNVSIRFSTDEEIVALIKKAEPHREVKFHQMFMPAVFKRLVKKPYLLLNPDMAPHCTALNDIVKYAARQNRGDDVLELVDLLWPTYSKKSSMKQKHSLLLDLSSIPRKLSSRSCVTLWVTLSLQDQAKMLEDKIKLFKILPNSPEYCGLYTHFCSLLPLRLSELHGVASSGFRVLLDTLDDRRDTLLDIVITLAANDNAKGWWDEALESCMSSVAAGADSRVLGAVYARCFEDLGLGVCTRLMAPLLRYSTPTLCEEFFSTTLEDLISTLNRRPREVAAHYTYAKCVLDYVRALWLLQLVFQKVPREHIESPRSVLYSKMSVGDAPSYVVRTVCKLCVTLRSTVRCPAEADEHMIEYCRLFHCANYNCLAAAICCTQLKPAVCATVFNLGAWDALVLDTEIELPLKQQWNQRSTRQTVSIEMTGKLLSLRTLATESTVRTRAFLRTLSENPFQYDLLQDEEERQSQELQLKDNVLNQHECAGTLAALLSRVSTLESLQWRDALVAALEGDARRNVKWLLSQAICNCKEDLKPHASVLRPALLAVVVATARDKKLNGLHIDMLDTLIFWRTDSQPSADLNSTIEYIITTAIDHRQNKNIYYMLLEKLVKMLDECVTIPWSCFEIHLKDRKSDIAKCCLDILKRVTKCNVHIPELLPALAEALEGKWLLADLSALFALAMTTVRERGQPEEDLLRRFRSILQRLRKNDHAEYVNVLHSAQRGFPGCCDEANFRSITDLTPKIVGRPKLKCLEILSTYVVNAKRNDYVTAMFDTVGLVDMTSTLEALVLTRNGLHLMEEHSRRRIVTQVAESCQQLPVKARSVAYGVLVKALELVLSPETKEPAAKRPARESNSILLSSDDSYIDIVSTAVAQGLVEKNEEISKNVREGVGRFLSEELEVRFCESFVLAIVLPSKNTSKMADGDNLAAMLDVFLQRIRSQEVFQKAKLRNEPMDIGQVLTPISSTKTLTRGNQLRIEPEYPTVAIDVQTSLDDVLKSLLQFFQKNPQAATSVIIQLVKAYKTKRPGFDFDSVMGAHVLKCLGTVCPLTPWILNVAREIDIWGSPDLEQTLGQLVKATRNTEGEGICKLFQEEYKMRRFGPELFLLGGNLNYDVAMSQTFGKFSMDDLISSFGKLSNWDDLTTQGKQSIKCTLPPLWTDQRNFDACAEDYDFTGCPTWLRTMVPGQRNYFQWISDLDKWPVRPFDMSAVMETKRWEQLRDQFDEEESLLPKYIPTSECLAEWAARVMFRSSYLRLINRDDSDGNYENLSHSYELLWCTSANERGLHAQALECCKRVSGLRQSETLRWLRQKMIALRGIALERNDSECLQSALNLAVTYTPQFVDSSRYEDILGMNEMMLRLRHDLKSLKTEYVESVTHEIKNKFIKGEALVEFSKQSLDSICVTAMSYYNAQWENCAGEDEQSELLLCMSEILDLFVNLDLGPKRKLLADMILNRLDEFTGQELDKEVALKLLSGLEVISQHLDDISIDQLTENFVKFPDCDDLKLRVFSDRTEMSKYRQCLSLVGDPEHLLLRYCESLAHVLEKEDVDEWARLFANMSAAIFDNQHAGPDYQVLLKYKKRLKDVAGAHVSKQTKKQALSAIQSELKLTRRDTLLLSHLCPALTQPLERDGGLSRLLCLKRGVHVAKFDEKVSVFVDSIRRPAVLRCRLSDGAAARFIVKRGERVRPHCVAMRLLTTAQAALPRPVDTGYYVAPLSEDSGLIQYLEEHERLKVLISSTCAVDGLVSAVHRAKDGELILAPKSSLQQFQQLCAKVPPYLLRSAIESTCATLQDFINKKKSFLESLSDMTVLSYLYGVGDRHLENVMYGVRDGGARHVDCGAILQYGGGELPPARLTRNILAVCDFTVLESRLQSILSALRDCQELLLPAISVAFKWMKDETLMQKRHHIEELLRGTTLSHLVAIDVLAESNAKYKEKYVELLEQVFEDFDRKEIYSVEEQVASLLRQSTEPRILSVTRSGWEPWI